MAQEDFSTRINTPTIPLDPADPPRFSQLIEVTKDCFQRELSDYFDYRRSTFQVLKNEVPTIEKYNLGFSETDTAVATFTHVLLQHPDILERLPLIAITTATGSALALGVGGQFVSSVQPAARIKCTRTGPYALEDGDRVAFITHPDRGPAVVSTALFRSSMFSDISAATIDEMIAVCASQFLYVSVSKTLYSNPIGVLRFSATGPIVRSAHPGDIEVLGPPMSSSNALEQLGLVPGTRDSTATRNPSNRYGIAMNLTVGIDLGAESENERRELTDLLLHFFGLDLDRRDFSLYGRSVFDEDFPGENFQIILKGSHSLAGEAEIPRQGSSGEQRDLIYVNRISVPVTVIDYVDREIKTYPRRGDDLDIRRGTDAELPRGGREGVG